MDKNLSLIMACLETGRPVLIEGPPGCGKSMGIKAACRERGWGFLPILWSYRDPTSGTGIPFVGNDGAMHFSVPEFITAVRKLAEQHSAVVLLHDELSQTPPAVQAVLLRGFLERVFGEHQLPDNVLQCAAANPPEMVEGGWDYNLALINRVTKLSWQPDAQAWLRWMESGDVTNDADFLKLGGDGGKLAAARSLTARYAVAIKGGPDWGTMLKMPGPESPAGSPFPSPRSWDQGVARKLARWFVGRTERQEKAEAMLLLRQSLSGDVGEVAAVQMLTYLENLDLPDIRDVLSDPDGFHWPRRGDIAYTVLITLVEHLKAHLTQSTYLAAQQVLLSAATAGHADLASRVVLAIQKIGQPKGWPLTEAVYNRFRPMMEAGGLV